MALITRSSVTSLWIIPRKLYTSNSSNTIFQKSQYYVSLNNLLCSSKGNFSKCYYGLSRNTISVGTFTGHTDSSLILAVRGMSTITPNPRPSEMPDKSGTGTPQTEKEPSPSTPEGPKELSTKEKLKQAVRDYGATVIVFHVTMSLMSLGFFYVLVSR